MSKKKMEPNPKVEYPGGTLAFYGPDNTRASKVVATIILNKHNELGETRKWYSEKEDVRNDRNIGEEITEFFKDKGVKTVVSSDGIIGCPHEEGIDYREGEYCPQCPFWVGRNRWTGEIEN